MITATSNTTQTYSYAQTSSSNQAKSSSFNELLQKEQTLEAQQAKTEEVRFKMIERMSYEYIKSLPYEKVESTYSDLPQEEINKIYRLRNLSNFSENETLNKVLFEKAKDMPAQEAIDFYRKTAFSAAKYETTGAGEIFILNAGDLSKIEKYNNENPTSTQKLSNEKAYSFLLDMVNNAKEGKKKYNGELQKLYLQSFNKFNDLLERYNNELKQNMTGSI